MNRKAGNRAGCCNTCNVHRRRKNLKDQCVEYMGGKCTICGYNKCTAAMVFHHLDPSTKEFAISGSAATFKWERIQAELDKCVLLCQNCHSEVHAGVAQLAEHKFCKLGVDGSSPSTGLS